MGGKAFNPFEDDSPTEENGEDLEFIPTQNVSEPMARVGGSPKQAAPNTGGSGAWDTIRPSSQPKSGNLKLSFEELNDHGGDTRNAQEIGAEQLTNDEFLTGIKRKDQDEAMARAIQEIDGLCGGGSGGGGGTPIEIGKLYHGRVTGIKDFGCFVECTPGKEGLCHISELADMRVRRTDDVVKMGEMVWVKCIGIDEKSGKVRLSRKAAMKEMEAQKQAEGAVTSPATMGTP